MASMREIKRRKESIQSTAQITNAMKLVSTVKFQKAKGKADTTKPYFDKMYETVNSILSKSKNILHPYLEQGKSPKKAMIVITSNRGLAGGYNSAVEKMIRTSSFDQSELLLYTVGRKGREALSKRGYTIFKDYGDIIESPVYRDAMDIGRDVLEAFTSGEVGEIWLAYTVFKNTITHIPKMVRLLPATLPEEDVHSQDTEDDLLLMNFEPSAEEVLDMLIPKYMNGIIYGAMMDAVASENGARMNAMTNATSNAEEMIDRLTLQYNRVRQGAITQEITEIVSGAEALK